MTWLGTSTVLEMVGGRVAYRHFMQEGAEGGKSPQLSGRMTAAMEQERWRLWLGGQVLGEERFARREVIRRAVLGPRIRPGDVARYLGISTRSRQ